MPAPASANALALLRFPDRRTAWVVVVAATLAAPADRLEERLAGLHRAVPMIGARLHGETWYPGPPPEPVIVDGDPLAAPELVARFDLATQPPLRVVAGSGGTRLAVACHHAAFDGLSLAALLATLVRPQGHPDDLGQLGPPRPPTEAVEAAEGVEGVEAAAAAAGVEGVDNREHPSSRSATLPLRGPEPRGPGLERARDLGGSGLDREAGPEGRGFDRGFGPWGAGPDPGTAGEASQGGRRSPELRGLVGRLIRPADRVAPSLARPGREALAVAEVDLAGPGVTSRLVSAAVAAAGAHNARLGRPWRRVGINIGLAAAAEAAEGRASIAKSGGERPGGNRTSGGGVAADRAAGSGGGGNRAAGGPSAANRTHQTEVSANQLPGNCSRYRRLDLGPAEAVAPALEAALASSREPLDQVWSPRWGWVLEPVVGRFSDSLLVSNLGRREVPGVTRLEFFPVARGRSAVAVGAVGLAGGPATVSVRARDLSSEDAEVLLADLVARLEAGA